MGAGPELDLDPEALRGVAADLDAVALALRALTGHVEPTAAAAPFGRPDADRRLATGLAGRCAELTRALDRAGQLAAALAGGLRDSADTVATADERSARSLRAAEG